MIMTYFIDPLGKLLLGNCQTVDVGASMELRYLLQGHRHVASRKQELNQSPWCETNTEVNYSTKQQILARTVAELAPCI